MDGEVEFAVLCFVVRSFEALGAAAFSTASCTILIDQFPDDIGTVFVSFCLIFWQRMFIIVNLFLISYMQPGLEIRNRKSGVNDA